MLRLVRGEPEGADDVRWDPVAGTIDAAALEEAGMIPDTKQPVKILGNGDLNKKFTVRATAFSSAAKEKIEKAGGAAEVVAV